MLPHYFWRIRFETPAAAGETLVIAPHPAGAKQCVASGIEIVTAFGRVESLQRVPPSMATQRFGGYFPGVRRALDAGRNTVGRLRG